MEKRERERERERGERERLCVCEIERGRERECVLDRKVDRVWEREGRNRVWDIYIYVMCMTESLPLVI